WTRVASRVLPFRKAELKSGFRTRPVCHSREPEIAGGSKPKLGAVMIGDLLVVVGRGQEEVLRRWLECLAVNHKARPPAAAALGSAWVTPMVQRWGWPAFSSLVREPSGKIEEGSGGGRIDADLEPVLHEHAHAEPGDK